MKKLMVVVAVMLFAAVAMAAEFGPVKYFAARKVTATTSATSVKALMALTAGGNYNCSVLVINPSSTALYVGGADVDATTKGVPVGTAAAHVGQSLKVDGDFNQVFLVVAAATLDVYVLAAGGC